MFAGGSLYVNPCPNPFIRNIFKKMDVQWSMQVVPCLIVLVPHSGGGAGAGFQITCVSDEKEEMILNGGGGGGGGFSSPGHLTGLRSVFPNAQRRVLV